MTIYVGNVAYKATEEDLRTLFEQYGEVSSVKIIRNPKTGRSKGFAFVEMPDDASASEAIKKINGTEFLGRSLKVDKANPPRKQRE